MILNVDFVLKLSNYTSLFYIYQMYPKNFSTYYILSLITIHCRSLPLKRKAVFIFRPDGANLSYFKL